MKKTSKLKLDLEKLRNLDATDTKSVAGASGDCKGDAAAPMQQ